VHSTYSLHSKCLKFFMENSLSVVRGMYIVIVIPVGDLVNGLQTFAVIAPLKRGKWTFHFQLSDFNIGSSEKEWLSARCFQFQLWHCYWLLLWWPRRRSVSCVPSVVRSIAPSLHRHLLSQNSFLCCNCYALWPNRGVSLLNSYGFHTPTLVTWSAAAFFKLYI
jgi:hypothetical protein